MTPIQYAALTALDRAEKPTAVTELANTIYGMTGQPVAPLQIVASFGTNRNYVAALNSKLNINAKVIITDEGRAALKAEQRKRLFMQRMRANTLSQAANDVVVYGVPLREMDDDQLRAAAFWLAGRLADATGHTDYPFVSAS